jgi:hypothetical protein
MALNGIMKPGFQFPVTLTTPAVPTSGCPILYGNLTGIALGILDPTTLQTVVDFGPGIWDIPVAATGGAQVNPGDTLFINAAGTVVSNIAAGFFYGIALEVVPIGTTVTINVMHMTSPGAGTLGAGTIATANLAANVLSADAPGRAKMATNYFLDPATVDDKFATGAIGEDHLAPTELTGRVVGLNATENVIGSIPVYHRMTIADVGAPTDYSLVLTHKTLITSWWIQNTGLAAHNTDDTINLKNVAASLSGAVPKTNVVAGLIRPATLVSGNCLVTAGNALVVTATKATVISCIVHILGVRSA